MVSDRDFTNAVHEIMKSIPEGASVEQISSELNEYVNKCLIRLDKAKVTVIKDHSNDKGQPPKKQFVNYKEKYGSKKKVSNFDLTPISSVSVGMKGIKIKGEVDYVESKNINGTDSVVAELSDDTGSINVTFWWDFTDLEDGDIITITYVSKVTSFRDELTAYVYYENNVIIDSDSGDDDEYDDDYDEEDEEDE